MSICAGTSFSDEFRIQLAWMRQSPPTANPGLVVRDNGSDR